jgi:uncharacterized OB-fold protein
MAAPRPKPRLDAENTAFWTGGAQGRLQIMRCRECLSYIHPPRPVCRTCLSDNVKPEAVPGTGVIDTFTINYQKWHPAMEVPFVIARVALDGAPGVYLTTNIVGCPVGAVDIGDRVRVTFESQDGIYFPLFEKIA